MVVGGSSPEIAGTDSHRRLCGSGTDHIPFRVEVGLGDAMTEVERVASYADLSLRRPEGSNIEIVDHKVTQFYPTRERRARRPPAQPLRPPRRPVLAGCADRRNPPLLLGPGTVSIPPTFGGVEAAASSPTCRDAKELEVLARTDRQMDSPTCWSTSDRSSCCAFFAGL